MGASSSKSGSSDSSWFSWGSSPKKSKKKCGDGEHKDKATHKCVKDGFNDYSGSEPEWTKKIPSWVICDWFFLFFVVNAFVLVLLLLSILYMTVSSTLPKTVRFTTLFMLVTQLLVSGTGTLFYYLLCDRSLKPSD